MGRRVVLGFVLTGGGGGIFLPFSFAGCLQARAGQAASHSRSSPSPPSQRKAGEAALRFSLTGAARVDGRAQEAGVDWDNSFQRGTQ